jgi:CheY-like chemotaxis protein
MAATLLLADDSVTTQRVIDLTFAHEGIDVVTVADGNEAMARLEADSPNIVLVDVGLPGIDGYRVAERVKQTPARSAIPVLLLTGAFEPIDEDRARQSGCDGVLVKPFEPQRLVATVKALLAGRRPEHLWPQDMPRIEPPTAPVVPPASPPTGPAPARTEPPPSIDIAEMGPMADSPAVEAEFESGLDDLDLAFSRLDPVAPPGRLDAGTVSDFQRDIQELRSTTPPASAEPSPAFEVAAPLSHLPIEEALAIEEADLQWDLPAPATTVQATPLPASFPDEPVEALPPVAVVPPRLEEPFPAAAVDEVQAVQEEAVLEQAGVSDRPAQSPRVEPTPEPEHTPEPDAAPDPQPSAVQTRPAPTHPPSLSAAFSALLAAEQSRTGGPSSPSPHVPEAVIEEVVRRVVARLAGEVARRVALESADRLIREEIERINR